MSKILLVEDEDMLSLIVKDSLEAVGYDFCNTLDGKKAVDMFKENCPDLVLLDVMMPDANGYEIAAGIRKINKLVPIIFISAKTQTEDIVKGFEIGANDYIRKPFAIKELIVRINNLLKGKNTNPEPEIVETKLSKHKYKIGNYIFDANMQNLSFQNDVKKMSYKESQVLLHLVVLKNEVVLKEKVLIDIWGEFNEFNSKNMDVIITRLRSFLKFDEQVSIINVRGIGYKLVDEC